MGSEGATAAGASGATLPLLARHSPCLRHSRTGFAPRQPFTHPESPPPRHPLLRLAKTPQNPLDLQQAKIARKSPPLIWGRHTFLHHRCYCMRVTGENRMVPFRESHNPPFTAILRGRCSQTGPRADSSPHLYRGASGDRRAPRPRAARPTTSGPPDASPGLAPPSPVPAPMPRRGADAVLHRPHRS